MLKALGGLTTLLPEMEPWTAAALWHGIIDCALPTTPLEDECDEVIRQRLGPLLLDYIRSRQVHVPSPLLRRLEDDDFAWARWRNVVVCRAGEAVSALEAADIPVCVTKGPGIGRTYPSARLRPFGDIDFIVRTRDFARARRVLGALGYAELDASRQPWDWFDRWCREGVNLKAISGGSVDLHHHIPPWWWARSLQPEMILARSCNERVLGTTLPLADPVTNLLVAALHTVSDRNDAGGTLLIWRDLVQLVDACAHEDVVALATTARLAPWLSDVLCALPLSVRPTVLIGELRRAPTRFRGGARLWLLLRRPRGVGVWVSQSLRLPVPLAALFVLGMAFPSPRFLRGKYPSARTPYGRWWRDTYLSRHADYKHRPAELPKSSQAVNKHVTYRVEA